MAMSQFMPEIASAHLQPGAQVRRLHWRERFGTQQSLSPGLEEGEMGNCQQERSPPLSESHLGAIATDTDSSGAG